MYSFKDIYQFSRGLSVLYVEDDLNLLKENSDIFEDYFKEVITAVDGLDGIEKYEHYKRDNNGYIDLVITDINMPRCDGLEMIRVLMQKNPQQVIIVTSAYNESERLISLIQEGIANFLMKPMQTKQLMKTLYNSCKNVAMQKQRDAYLMQQSKLAAVGTMIDAIAHQWLQPINNIKLQTMVLELNNKNNELNKEKIDHYIKKHLLQVNHLNETIQEFRAFFREESTVTLEPLKEIIQSTLLLLNDTLMMNNITINLTVDDSLEVRIIPNEFKHVIINIINNAIEAFNDNDIKNRSIDITTKENDAEICLSICDNAGGIAPEVIDNIFNESFTTKRNGTGVGMYLSMMIINKISGRLEVSSDNDRSYFNVFMKK
jgi:signal transduction histidine kinase